jgi:hypothetical protein
MLETANGTSTIQKEQIKCEFGSADGHLFALQDNGLADLGKKAAANRCACLEAERFLQVPDLRIDTGPCAGSSPPPVAKYRLHPDYIAIALGTLDTRYENQVSKNICAETRVGWLLHG